MQTLQTAPGTEPNVTTEENSGGVAPAPKPMTLFLKVDHALWEVVRRHEMCQLMTRETQRDRMLFLFFHGPNGEMRRGEIAEDFPTNPSAELLEKVWLHSEVLSKPVRGEMHSQSDMDFPSMGKALKLMFRAVTLRCPNCGSFGVLKSWFKLNHHCKKCYMRFERGESEDYYLGGMMFNIILAEALFAIGFVTSLLVMWPNVPWKNLEYTLVVAAIVAPIFLYPFSRIIWLAFDLIMRPVTPEELEWHKQESMREE